MVAAEIQRITIQQGRTKRINGYRISPHSDRKTDRFESSGFRTVENPRRFSFDRLKQKTPKRIPLISHREEILYGQVGDTFRVGKGTFEIIHYDPVRRWRHPHGTEPTVVCKLIDGSVIPDFEDVATRWSDGKITINLCVKTLSHYYKTNDKRDSVKTGHK